MKKRNLIMLSVLPFMSVSCTYSKKTEPQIIKTDKKIEDEKWSNFLAQESINYLLTDIFENEEEKQKYVNSQKELGLEYLNKIKPAYYFGSNIVRRYKWDSYYDKKEKKMVDEKPIVLSESDKLINELMNKNWLFFLYNIDNFNFAYYPEIDLFANDLDESTRNVAENNIKFGVFYKPKTKKILQYAKQIYIDENDYKENKYFLLTEEGFILNLRVEKDIDLDSTSTYMHQYIYTYPELVANKENLNQFNIAKYVDAVQNEIDRSFALAFEDIFGGDKLRYCVNDIMIE